MAANGNRYLHIDPTTFLETEQAANDGGASGVAGDIVALDGTAKIPLAFFPAGLGVDTASIASSEALTAGDYVNVHVSSGTKVRKADASTAAGGKRAHGFVLANVAFPGTALVYFSGQNTAVTGLTAGVMYCLSDTTPGGVLALSAGPTTAGRLLQVLGVAIDAAILDTDIDDKPIIRG